MPKLPSASRIENNPVYKINRSFAWRLAFYRLFVSSKSEMRPRLPSCGVLRACPNATPGPSRLPAGAVKIYRHSLPVTQIRNESTIPTRRTRQASTSASSTSTSTPSLTTSTSPSAYPHPAFDQLSTSLSSWLPCFGARGDEVKLLTSPGGFYGDVIEMMKRAKRRILISTLYIGVEETELACLVFCLLGGPEGGGEGEMLI